jgi:hypothetical protein
VTRILICGDRNWSDYDFILHHLKKYIDEHHPDAIDFVIEGEARGADSLGRQAAESLGIIVLKFPANWEKFGRAAGPIRNKQMLDEGKPDVVWVFHDDLSKSRGTNDMIRQARKRGVPVYIHSHIIGKDEVVEVIIH